MSDISIIFDGELCQLNQFVGLEAFLCKKCGSNPDHEFTDGPFGEGTIYMCFCCNDECEQHYEGGDGRSPQEAVSKWNRINK